MNLNLGSSHSWRRRLDEARYLPGDLVRRLRSARERGLAAWAGYSVGQRLSSVGLAAAVAVALVVVVTGGRGFGDSSTLVVAKDAAAETAGTMPARHRRDAEARPSTTVADTTPPAAPDPSMELTVVDNSAVVTEVDTADSVDTEVLAATTVPGKTAKAKSNGNALAALFQAALQSARITPPSSGGSPSPTPSPIAGPTNPPANPPGTASPTTRPSATTPPTTRPPVTAPPTTRPPVTAPPTTSPPITAPPTTSPPITAPPTTDPPATTSPPVTTPPPGPEP